MSRTDRLGRRQDFIYDELDRRTLATWVAAGGGTVNLLTYTYDPNNNLLTAADFDGTYTMTYDALDRLKTQKDLFNLTLTFTYNKVDNRTKVEDSLGGVTTSTYDAAYRLTRREFNGGGQGPVRIDFTYTNRDQVATLTRWRDLAGTQKVGSTVYVYDGTMRLVNLQHQDAANSNIANYTYTYDLSNRLTSEERNGVTRSYEYNLKDELTVDGTATFSYDLNGNRTLTGYVTGANNRLLADGTLTYTYDAEGNQVQSQRLDDTDVWSYTYDHNNQLLTAEHRATVGGAVDLRLDFQYDVFGRRIERARDADGAGGQAAVVTRFAYDGTAIWADLDGSSSLTTRRLFGDGTDELLARLTSTNTIAWYLTDRLGSVREMVDNTGTLQDTITYGAYGNIESETNPTFSDSRKFTGKELEADFGWQLHGARWLSVATGRWNAEDPIWINGGSANLYGYVGNGPTNAIDPTGTTQYVIGRQNAQHAQDWLKAFGVATSIQSIQDAILPGNSNRDEHVQAYRLALLSNRAPDARINQPGDNYRLVRSIYEAANNSQNLWVLYFDSRDYRFVNVPAVRSEEAYLTNNGGPLQPSLGEQLQHLPPVSELQQRVQERPRLPYDPRLTQEQGRRLAEHLDRAIPFNSLGQPIASLPMSGEDPWLSQRPGYTYNPFYGAYLPNQYTPGRQPLGFSPEGMQEYNQLQNWALQQEVTTLSDTFLLTSLRSLLNQIGPKVPTTQAPLTTAPRYVVNSGLPPAMPAFNAVGNSGRTTGLLIFREHGQTFYVRLASGVNNATNAGLASARNLPGATSANWHHVEFQALEIMRQRGITNASLLHNYPSGLPCGHCMPGGSYTPLQSSLGNGSQLSIFGLTPSPAGSTSPWMVSPAGSVRVNGTW